MAKKKQAKFSVTKAVKRNARERVGQPKPERVIVSEAQQAARQASTQRDARGSFEARGMNLVTSQGMRSLGCVANKIGQADTAERIARDSHPIQV